MTISTSKRDPEPGDQLTATILRADRRTADLPVFFDGRYDRRYDLARLCHLQRMPQSHDEREFLFPFGIDLKRPKRP